MTTGMQHPNRDTHPTTPTPCHSSRHHGGVAGAAVQDSETAARWLEDLQWWQRAYRPAKVKWLVERIVGVATSATGGRVDFTTVADLALLARFQEPVVEIVEQVRAGAAPMLLQARDVLGGPGWVPVAQALQMSTGECERAVQSAAGVRIGEPAAAAVGQALRLAEGVYSNPLVQAWELRHMWLGYEAAVDLLEDTLCDLVVELRERHELETLAVATGDREVGRLELRVAKARSARGGPGDDRRVPRPRGASR